MPALPVAKATAATAPSETALTMLLLVGLSLCLTGCGRQQAPLSAEDQPALPPPTAPLAPPTLSPIDRATLFCPGGGWILEFFPNGGVRAQYGALPGDEGELPPGSVDFAAVVEANERQRSDRRIDGAAQAAIHRRGETSIHAHSLRDDSYFRELIERAEGKWIPGERFAELRQKMPFFPPPEQP